MFLGFDKWIRALHRIEYVARTTTDGRRDRLAREHGTLFKTGSYRMSLLYPNPYSVAMSSLGYQVMYRLFNAHPDVVCERAVLPDDVPLFRQKNATLTTMESNFPVGGSDCVAISLAFEPDLAGVFTMLDLARIPVLRSERSDHHPPVIIGGPITMSNALPLAPIADVVVIGDGELAAQPLLEALLSSVGQGDRNTFLETLASTPGMFVPAIHGDRVPAALRVTTDDLPAIGQIWTPDAELGDMLLIETSRGCPRFCSFCVMRQTAQPMRSADPQRVEEAMNSDAPRFGFVGAAVSEYPHIKRVLQYAVDHGKGVGVSSLRADRLDDEFVELLQRGGYRTMTIASDAPSQAMRNRIKKGLRDRHLIHAAELAARYAMRIYKMYVIVGLPGETDEDIDELADFSLMLQKIVPRVALSLSPFVPKLHTPLGDAPFADIKVLERRIRRLRQRVKGKVELRSVSPRWAWVEYRLSQGGIDVGLAAVQAWRDGGTVAAYRQAFKDHPSDHRAALAAADHHGLWQPAGMR